MDNQNIIKKKIYNKEELQKILNIDFDFLIIDSFVLESPFKQGIGSLCYNKSKFYFNAHFINNPTMPGTLQTEAMLQTIISIIYLSDPNIKNCLVTKCKLSFLDKIDRSSNFQISAKILNYSKGIVEASASVSLNKKKFSRGEFNFIIPEIFQLNKK